MIYIIVAIICATAIWPINRWMMRNNGRAVVFGFWLSLIGAAGSAAVALFNGESFAKPGILFNGVVIGIAFAFGYCLIIMYCLKIGPTAPTVAINNMGLVGPVILGAFWPKPHSFAVITVFGLVLVCISLLLFGFIKPPEGNTGPEAKKISGRWLFWVFAGWLFSVVSISAQYVGSFYAAESPFVLMFSFTATAALILVFTAFRELKKRFETKELIAGGASGALMITGIIVSFKALKTIPPEGVFPFTIAGPIILVLLIGQFIYRERMNMTGWIAFALGVSGMIALSVK